MNAFPELHALIEFMGVIFIIITIVVARLRLKTDREEPELDIEPLFSYRQRMLYCKPWQEIFHTVIVVPVAVILAPTLCWMLGAAIYHTLLAIAGREVLVGLAVLSMLALPTSVLIQHRKAIYGTSNALLAPTSEAQT